MPRRKERKSRRTEGEVAVLPSASVFQMEKKGTAFLAG